MMKHECRMTKTETSQLAAFDIRTSDFLRHWLFGIRISRVYSRPLVVKIGQFILVEPLNSRRLQRNNPAAYALHCHCPFPERRQEPERNRVATTVLSLSRRVRQHPKLPRRAGRPGDHPF